MCGAGSPLTAAESFRQTSQLAIINQEQTSLRRDGQPDEAASLVGHNTHATDNNEQVCATMHTCKHRSTQTLLYVCPSVCPASLCLSLCPPTLSVRLTVHPSPVCQSVSACLSYVLNLCLCASNPFVWLPQTCTSVRVNPCAGEWLCVGVCVWLSRSYALT